MKIVIAEEAKNGIVELMEDTQRDQVVIQNRERASAVTVPEEEYKNIKLEHLRERLAVGMEQADRGDFAEYSLDELIAELDREA